MSITMGELATRYAQAAPKVTVQSEKELRKFSQVGVGLVKKSIQEFHAVDTSTMLNSTTAEKNGDTYLIGPTTDYALYVALGTSRMPARPFHTKAAKALQSKIDKFGMKPEDLGI